MRKPLKRQEYLKPFSRDHHQQLMFCFNLEKGVQKEVVPQHLKDYCLWFDENYLSPHFQVEEKMLKSLLPKNNTFLNATVQQHDEVRRFLSTIKNEVDIGQFKQLAIQLRKSVRWEERTLFEHLQDNREIILPNQAEHNEISCSLPWKNAFWE